MKILYPLKGIGNIPGIYLTQRFGEHPEIYSQFGMKGHNGLDFGCPVGTSILAPFDGIVSYADETTNYGTGYGMDARLMISLNGLQYELIFGHLSEYKIPGAYSMGDVIALSGDTGFSTGPHLHFGIRPYLNGQIADYNNGYLGWVNPEPFMRMIVRTLKLDGTKELGYYIPADTEDRFASLQGEIKNLEDYQLDDTQFLVPKKWNNPI